ncbi:MAG: hypothetical protein M0Z52_12065 [Actinomycetota bacterium]|nr:hypothetical protein [Nitrospiraceae bacterium]MDA8157164.1 hypothetical protein [Actinomycetota bacterium]
MKKQSAKKDRAGLYKIKAGPEVVTQMRNRRFEDKKKKAASCACRTRGQGAGEENWPGEGV